MATIIIEAGGQTYERTVDAEQITLGFLEDLEAAQTSGKWRDLIPAIASLLDLPRDVTRQVSIRQWRDVAAALGEASNVPNESGPSSE